MEDAGSRRMQTAVARRQKRAHGVVPNTLCFMEDGTVALAAFRLACVVPGGSNRGTPVFNIEGSIQRARMFVAILWELRGEPRNKIECENSPRPLGESGSFVHPVLFMASQAASSTVESW